MRRGFITGLLIFGVSLNQCSAGIGGATLWSVVVTSTDRDPVSTGEYGEIGAVGDDGVVLVGIGKKVFEITPPNGGVPVADRKSTRLNSSHPQQSRMPSSA